MHQFLEAAALALQAIWANKLRSLLTVLGNIVAVTSIIAVVSLVQGLNATVSDAIQSQFAADTFAVMRTPPSFTDEEQLRRAEQPASDARSMPRRSGRSAPSVAMVMAESSSGGQGEIPRRNARQHLGCGA